MTKTCTEIQMNYNQSNDDFSHIIPQPNIPLSPLLPIANVTQEGINSQENPMHAIEKFTWSLLIYKIHKLFTHFHQKVVFSFSTHYPFFSFQKDKSINK